MNYSIITCTYNASKYIESYFKCIEDIEYSDFEVIIVDDASNDNTFELLNKLSIKFGNVKVFQQERNCGPGSARNKALEYASGQKIVFLDIDDKFEKNIFSVLDNYEADCIYFNYYKWLANDKLIKCSSLKGTINIDDCNIEEIMCHTTGAVWGKVFKKSIIAEYKIKFPQLYKTEDLVFLLRYLTKCKYVQVCQYPLYYYRISSSSLMHTDVENQVVNSMKAMNYLKKDLVGYEKTYKIIYSKEILYDVTNIYVTLNKGNKELVEFWRQCDCDINIGDYRKYYSMPQRISLFFIKYKNVWGLKLMNCIRKYF